MSNYWLKAPLFMWTNEYEYVIATSLREAKKYCGQGMFGKNNPKALELYEEFEREEMDSQDDWYCMDPERTFRYDHGDGEVENATVQEYIDRQGAGHFACSEC